MAKDRDVDNFFLVQDVNNMRHFLHGAQANLFHTDERVNQRTVKDMKAKIGEEFLPRLMTALDNTTLDPSYDEDTTFTKQCRDALLNVGVGLFLIGLYLIMMASEKIEGPQALAASFHLQKGIFQDERKVCPHCGHTNCHRCRQEWDSLAGERDNEGLG